MKSFSVSTTRIDGAAPNEPRWTLQPSWSLGVPDDETATTTDVIRNLAHWIASNGFSLLIWPGNATSSAPSASAVTPPRGSAACDRASVCVPTTLVGDG